MRWYQPAGEKLRSSWRSFARPGEASLPSLEEAAERGPKAALNSISISSSKQPQSSSSSIGAAAEGRAM